MGRSLGNNNFLSCLISFEMISTTFLLAKIALPLGWRFSHGFDDVTVCVCVETCEEKWIVSIHILHGVIVRGTLQSTRVEKNYVLGVKSCFFFFSFFLVVFFL
jgi:hypothetical protein